MLNTNKRIFDELDDLFASGIETGGMSKDGNQAKVFLMKLILTTKNET